MLITALRCIYFVLLTPLIIYALNTLYVLIVYFRHLGSRPPLLAAISDEHLPHVTVQIPLYNERYVVCRVLDAVAALDYPRDKLLIQVLDDSTDDTTELIEGWINVHASSGLQIQLLHRSDRTGYKAGALANGLKHTESEYIAIFDADFTPQPDFLRRTLPYFNLDRRIGVVQGRWGHLNAGDNLLTRSQALMLDGHFAVEQFARSHDGLIFSFNGTGGIWRRECIEDAGGWSHDTLAEDADLSYRAHIRGWRFIFLRNVVVPGEISPQISGFKQQQARWSKGTTQVLLKIMQPLWRSRLSLRKRLIGTVQLLAYPIQPFGLAAFLMMPLMIMTGALNDLPLAPLGLASLAVPVLYIAGQAALYTDWTVRSFVFPLLLMLSTGMAVNNSAAVISALRGEVTEFKRTPKFRLEGGDAVKSMWRGSAYAALADKHAPWEIGFTLYALFGAAVAVRYTPSLIPYFLLYALGFFSVASWGIMDRWLAARAKNN